MNIWTQNKKRGVGTWNLNSCWAQGLCGFATHCYLVSTKRERLQTHLSTNHCAGMGITIRCEDHCLAIIRHVHLEALEVENHLKLSALLYQASLLDWNSKLLQNYKLKFCQSRGCRWKLKKTEQPKWASSPTLGRDFLLPQPWLAFLCLCSVVAPPRQLSKKKGKSLQTRCHSIYSS